jgi:hypothetical protein
MAVSKRFLAATTLALLEHRGATLWAPWSLLRPIFEASFFAS